jgi:AcrR family transcriptional regulator
MDLVNHWKHMDGLNTAIATAASAAFGAAREKRPSGRLTTDRPDGIHPDMAERKDSAVLRSALLDAAVAVVERRGIANLTLDAVAAEAGTSKGGLLHHFPSKDRLVEALVRRSAENWRACYTEAYENTPPGPGRMARALLDHCLSDAECWTDELRRNSSTVFAALAQNPSLIEPMRAVYSDLHQRIALDGLPAGVSETVLAAIDGLWLNWVLGLFPISQERAVRVRHALEGMLKGARPTPSPAKKPIRSPKRSGKRHL